MATPHPSRLLDAYVAQTNRVRASVQHVVVATWNDMNAWRDSDIDDFARVVAPVVTGGQRRIATLTDSYLATLTAIVTGAPTRPVGIPADVVTDATMRGVDAREVYRRMGPTVWTALAHGRPLGDAVHDGLTRATVAAGTDLQLAKTHATRYALERNDRATGYARVPDGDACDLCLLASENTYGRGDLMPIHDRCNCDVEPLLDDGDRVASSAPSTDGIDTELAVHEHGELGPVLGVAGQHFTGPDDL
jgi:hypothetical protein